MPAAITAAIAAIEAMSAYEIAVQIAWRIGLSLALNAVSRSLSKKPAP